MVPEVGIEPTRPEGHGILSDHERWAPSANNGSNFLHNRALARVDREPVGTDVFTWLSIFPAKWHLR
jgi:hypothetical protein